MAQMGIRPSKEEEAHFNEAFQAARFESPPLPDTADRSPSPNDHTSNDDSDDEDSVHGRAASIHSSDDGLLSDYVLSDEPLDDEHNGPQHTPSLIDLKGSDPQEPLASDCPHHNPSPVFCCS